MERLQRPGIEINYRKIPYDSQSREEIHRKGEQRDCVQISFSRFVIFGRKFWFELFPFPI